MTTHPYAQPLSGLDQIINHMRKSPLKNLDASTLKKLSIAPNNESYIVNTLKSLGLFDSEGKAIESATNIFYESDDKFQQGLVGLIENAYADLFELHSDAWSQTKPMLVSFFRSADKSSELVGGRQADTFIKLGEMAGKRDVIESSRVAAPRTSQRNNVSPTQKKPKNVPTNDPAPAVIEDSGVSLSVRVEVNLPATSDQTVYDAIFKSIRQQLIDRGQN